MSENNGNGHGEYNPKVYYRHLGADVWEKLEPDEVEGEGKIAYSDDLKADLEDSDNSEEDNSHN